MKKENIFSNFNSPNSSFGCDVAFTSWREAKYHVDKTHCDCNLCSPTWKATDTTDLRKHYKKRHNIKLTIDFDNLIRRQFITTNDLSCNYNYIFCLSFLLFFKDISYLRCCFFFVLVILHCFANDLTFVLKAIHFQKFIYFVNCIEI